VTATAEQLTGVELASGEDGDITVSIRWMEDLAGITNSETAASQVTGQA
jgi:hypothetical protein